MGNSDRAVRGTCVPNDNVSNWSLSVHPSTIGSPVAVHFGNYGRSVHGGNTVPNGRVSSYNYNVYEGFPSRPV